MVEVNLQELQKDLLAEINLTRHLPHLNVTNLIGRLEYFDGFFLYKLNDRKPRSDAMRWKYGERSHFLAHWDRTLRGFQVAQATDASHGYHHY